MDANTFEYLMRATASAEGIKLSGALDRRSYAKVAQTLERAGCVLNRREQIWTHPTKTPRRVLAELLMG